MLTSLYFFGENKNGIWGKDVLFDIMDNPINVVASTEGFANTNEEEAESAVNGFVYEENDD